MIAALYVRVSTLNQVDRDSLSNQESRLKAYCEANGYIVRDVYKDAGFSAKDTNRPALRRLFKDIKSGKVEAVLVTKLDRITRSLRDLVKLVDFFSENSVKFKSITQNVDSSGPFGRFMRDLLGLIAQLEREVTAERVAEDMHHRALLGKWNGGIIPYGYTTQRRAAQQLRASGLDEHHAAMEAASLFPQPKKLYLDEEEAAVVREIFSDYISGRSLRKVTHGLNSKGVRTRNGAPWAASSVRRVLTNPTYVGKIWYGKRKVDPQTGKLHPVSREEWKVSEGEHQAIVSQDAFDQAQAILASNFSKPTRAHNTYLLAGLLRCGKCGGPMHGYTFTKKTSGKTYAYYKCHNCASKGKAVCEGMTVQARPLEDFVVKTLMELSENTQFLGDKEKMLSALKEEAERLSSGRNDGIERLRVEDERLQARLDTLLEKLELGLIDDADFDKRYRGLKEALARNRMAREKLDEAAEQPGAALDALNASFDEIASFGRNWDFLDEQGRKLKIQTVVKQIDVFKDRVDMQVFLDVDEVSRMDRGSWPPPG